MKKRVTITITAIVIVFGGIIFFNLLKNFKIKQFFAHYEPPAVSVSSVIAVKKPWHPKIPAVGNFVATNGVDVNSQASGNVVKIHFESGQYVEAGSSLIDIEDNIDVATLKFNQAQLSLKQISYRRQLDLGNRGAASISTVDEAKANLEQAEANVEKSLAVIKQKHIFAPFSGKLGIRMINLGQFISPGETAIVTLQSLDPMYLDFYLPEQDLTKLAIKKPIRFKVEAFKDKVFTGEISAINAKIDPNTHNVKVQATLPNCPAQALIYPQDTSLVQIKTKPNSKETVIKCDTASNTRNHVTQFAFTPGMFASIAVEQPSNEEVVLLPSTAISYSLYGNAVYVIENDPKGEKDADGKIKQYAKRVFVSTGQQAGNFTIITKGITPGQVVVGSGELKLQNGARVSINNSTLLNENVKVDNLGQ